MHSCAVYARELETVGVWYLDGLGPMTPGSAGACAVLTTAVCVLQGHDPRPRAQVRVVPVDDVRRAFSQAGLLRQRGRYEERCMGMRACTCVWAGVCVCACVRARG